MCDMDLGSHRESTKSTLQPSTPGHLPSAFSLGAPAASSLRAACASGVSCVWDSAMISTVFDQAIGVQAACRVRGRERPPEASLP